MIKPLRKRVDENPVGQLVFSTNIYYRARNAGARNWHIVVPVPSAVGLRNLPALCGAHPKDGDNWAKWWISDLPHTQAHYPVSVDKECRECLGEWSYMFSEGMVKSLAGNTLYTLPHYYRGSEENGSQS